VGAKDKATGKENKITIKANSGLIGSRDPANGERRRTQRCGRQEETGDWSKRATKPMPSVHSVKKSLAEHGDKLEAGEKEKIEAAVKEVEEAYQKATTKTASTAKTEALMDSQLRKLGEKVYADMQAQQQAAAAGGGAAADARQKACDDNVVDAEVKEVKEAAVPVLQPSAAAAIDADKAARRWCFQSHPVQPWPPNAIFTKYFGCTQKRHRRRNQKVVPQAGDEIPP
jgi:molecular chaperone DnaK